MKTLTLALQDQWPCRRDRWWALLAPLEFDLTNLKSWAKDDLHSTIGHIIPDWPLWDNQVEEELQLTETELYHYNNHLFGMETWLLEQSGICPTILHSYGSVFTKCPCGCRNAAFRPERLQRGGVRGCYVLSQTTGKPRFLHTAEAALLCTVPPNFKFPGGPRTGLCLIGQIAAPLQAQWMCLHLVQATQLFYGWEPVVEPQIHIQHTKHHLQWQRHHLWTLTRHPACVDQGPTRAQPSCATRRTPDRPRPSSGRDQAH